MRFPGLITSLVVLMLPPAHAAARRIPPEPMRLLVSQADRTWSLQERLGGAYRTLLQGAHVRAVRGDGTEVVFTSLHRGEDGHSFTAEADDLKVKVLVQWLAPSRLPSTATLLPMLLPKRPGVVLRELSVAADGVLPGIGEVPVILENGYQSWSRTAVRPLDAGAPVTSWWVTAVRSPKRSFLAGYLSSVLGLNVLTVSRDAAGTVRLADRSDYRRLPVASTPAGTPVDALYLSWGDSPSDMLAEYAAGTRVFTNVMDPAPAFRPLPVPTGWCSWYGWYGEVREENVIAAADAARRDYGTRDFRYIQVDDGYQVAVGEWDANEKFPHGHRWLTDQIHARGYKAGLWIDPFDVTPKSRVFRDHPEYLLRRPDGSLAQFGTNDRWGGPVHALDPSLPAVRTWLRDLFRRVTKEWGYDYVKIDFLFHPLEPNTVMAGGMTPVQAYREALKAIREGCGPDTYILGCGAPIGPSIGLVNGMRIGPDVSTAWPGILDAARNAANRQWMHNVWWQNDPDALVLRNPLTPDQARAWTAAVALSGGLTMLGDDISRLEPDRLALARMALPVSANGNAPAFGPKPAASMRATGMRLADMWAARGTAAPAFRDANGTVVLTLRTAAWRLRTGDERSWADTDLNDNTPDWRPIAPGVPWETLPGLESYDGYAWYRVHFRLAPGVPPQPFTLDLGRIDDVDETFVNGRRVGQTGQFPSDYRGAAGDLRRYTIPADDLRWEPDAENVLAIRVYDGGGDGGLVDLGSGEPPSLWRLPPDISPAKITVLGAFNWGNSARRVTVSPANLGVAPRGKRVHAWDIWNARYLGAVNAAYQFDLPPASSMLIAMTPDVGHPQLLGTDAHVTSGARDVLGVRWAAEQRVLKGRCAGTPGRPFHLAVTVPSGYRLTGASASGAAMQRQESAAGSATFLVTPNVATCTWTVQYQGGPAIRKAPPKTPRHIHRRRRRR